MRFAGRTVLVAGGGSVGERPGNGQAAAILYAREGARVLVADRDRAAAGRTVAMIEAEGGVAEAIRAELTDSADCAAAVARGDPLDVLHFNVGTSLPGGVVDTEPQDWSRLFSVNVDAAFHLSRAALPGMVLARRGALVFVSSVAAIRAGPYSYAAYEASKAALGRMARSIARAHAPDGVRANTVLPGLIDTPHVEAVVAPGADPATLGARRSALVPMGRQGTPWEVARAALFLASDDASFVTGAELVVDGGSSL